MKNFLNITKEELKKMKSHRISVYEKLDMVYFKVEVKEDSIRLFSSKGRELTNVDFIINTVNRDIRDFVDMNIRKNAGVIIERFGECRIGFFYLPVHKTKSVDYYAMDEGKFILSDIYTKDKSKNDIDKMFLFLGGAVEPVPLIAELDNLDDDDIKNILEFSSSNDYMSLATMFTDSNTYTGLELYEIEGIIISWNGDRYQLLINENKIKDDMSTRKLYRDTVVENFVSSVPEDTINKILETNKSPEDKVCDLFLEYMDCTNLFLKTYIEKEDLLPPHEGYMGDIDWDVLPSTVRLVCRGDERYKNILKILFSVLMSGDIDRKVKDFSQVTGDVLKKINKKLLG